MKSVSTYGDRMDDGALLTTMQQAVLAVLRLAGPCDDTDLVACYVKNMQEGKVPRQGESGIRTRRRELADGGLVYDTGRREQLPSGRTAVIWNAR